MTDFRPVEVEVEGVRLVWTGGRLADVIMPTKYDRIPHAVECLEVGEYDWDRGEQTRAPTRPELRTILLRWLRDDYSTTWRNA